MIREILEMAAAMAELTEACKAMYDALPEQVVEHPGPRRHSGQKMKPRAGYPRQNYWHRTRSNPYSRKRARQRARQRATATQGRKQ